jgi:hypothetical protein
MAAGWNPSTAAGLISVGSGDTADRATLRAGINAVKAQTVALDVANFKNSNFMISLSGGVDPVIAFNERFRARTRGSLGYQLGVSTRSDPGTLTISYSEINPTTAPSTYSYTHTVSRSSSSVENVIALELGGVLEFNDSSGFLRLGAGLFYAPTFDLTSLTTDATVDKAVTSWTDTTAANEAAGLAAIGPGQFEGKRTDTTTTAYANEGKGSDNVITNTFWLPVSARLALIKDKLALIGGYILSFEEQTRTVSTPSGTTTVVTTVADTSGATVYPPAGTPVSAASSTTDLQTTRTVSSTVWNGCMSFMLRWTPVESITADLFGQTIMNALNFAILGSGGGFNPNNFISSLGVSLTYHIR